ncbi:MerR family transcriptional regulator [Pseudaquidulcibacter saccharophilus]|uniref:MerR family transcriptional regulator n=1 Tax=Pseudaquidulcibacter saccharophilus TaxID=2831900 RepID=UPI001EFF0C55|nr:MerR family transcriptional regulator [Pseudaquidulcibacter saccharophilus]
MKIGDIALETGFSIETIRFYEKQRLVKNVGRNANNYRDYGEEQIAQLVFIKQCRNIGLGLEEVKSLQSHLENPQSDCGEVNRLIGSALKKVREQLKLLHETEQQLKHLNSLCDHSGASHECGIMNELRTTSNF